MPLGHEIFHLGAVSVFSKSVFVRGLELQNRGVVLAKNKDWCTSIVVLVVSITPYHAFETFLCNGTYAGPAGAIYGRNSEIGIDGNTAFKNNSAGNTAGKTAVCLAQGAPLNITETRDTTLQCYA